MLSIIREMFHGNLSPKGTYKRNSDYDKALKAMADAEAKLLSALNDSEKALYEDYVAAQREFSTLEGADHFAYGFILGTSIQNEVMTGIKDVML